MTITPISVPDDQEPDLFEPDLDPAPLQYDLFEEELQEGAPTLDTPQMTP